MVSTFGLLGATVEVVSPPELEKDLRGRTAVVLAASADPAGRLLLYVECDRRIRRLDYQSVALVRGAEGDVNGGFEWTRMRGSPSR